MRAAEAGVLASVLLFVAAFLALGGLFYGYGMTVFRFPLIVGAVTCGLVAIRLARLAARGATPAGASSDSGRRFELASVPGLAWVFSLLPAVYLLGYLAGPALFLFAYLRAHGENWWISAGFPAACLAIVYFGFAGFLKVPLPLLPFWLT